MKSPSGEAKLNIDIMKEYFFLGLPDSFFNNLREKRIDAVFSSPLITFIESIEAFSDATSLPFQISSKFVMSKAFSMYGIRNSILFPDLNHKEINKKAREEFERSLETQEDADRIFYEIAGSLLKVNEEINKSSKELLYQGVLLIWSALEVFFRDFIKLFFNENPIYIKNIIHNEYLHKRNDLKKLSLEFMIENDFNLSDKIGLLLIDSYDCSDLITIKQFFSCITNHVRVMDLLESKDLWVLFQLRHLIVHRRCIIDKAYIEKTGSTQSIGDRVIVLPIDLMSYSELARDIVTAIIEEIVISKEILV